MDEITEHLLIEELEAEHASDDSPRAPPKTGAAVEPSAKAAAEDGVADARLRALIDRLSEPGVLSAIVRLLQAR